MTRSAGRISQRFARARRFVAAERVARFADLRPVCSLSSLSSRPV
jgi:hypothetical protein